MSESEKSTLFNQLLPFFFVVYQNFFNFFIEKECDAEFAQMLYEKAPRVLDDLYRDYQKENDTTGESFRDKF